MRVPLTDLDITADDCRLLLQGLRFARSIFLTWKGYPNERIRQIQLDHERTLRLKIQALAEHLREQENAK